MPQQQTQSQHRIPVKKEAHPRVDTVVVHKTDTLRTYVRVDTVVIFEKDSTIFERMLAVHDTTRDRVLLSVPIPFCVSSVNVPVSQATIVPTITPEPATRTLVLIGFSALFIILYATRNRKR